jgi:hypothetical protein
MLLVSSTIDAIEMPDFGKIRQKPLAWIRGAYAAANFNGQSRLIRCGTLTVKVPRTLLPI